MKISQIIEKNKAAILLIDLHKQGEGNQKQISIRGTGFVVSSDGKFITRAHVYKQIPSNEIDLLGASVPGEANGKNSISYNRYPVKLLSIDEENDVALMQIVSDKTDFKTIEGIETEESIVEGDEALFVGYPLATELLSMGFGLTMTTNKCIVSSVKRRGSDGSLHFYLVDTHVNNGSSGSPLFSADTGKVIGIVSARINMSRVAGPTGGTVDIPANLGICRPSIYIDKLIKNN